MALFKKMAGVLNTGHLLERKQVVEHHSTFDELDILPTLLLQFLHEYA